MEKNEKIESITYKDLKKLARDIERIKRHIELCASSREERKFVKEKEELLKKLELYIDEICKPSKVGKNYTSAFLSLVELLEKDYVKIQSMPKGEDKIELTHEAIDSTNEYTDEINAWTRLKKTVFDVGRKNGYIKIDGRETANKLFEYRSNFGIKEVDARLKLLGRDFNFKDNDEIEK
ncbi:MAG: hypothetical protein IJT25_00495 [Clostridia bacterium]|nr:hypothetical protein [Clostridia bacterium]